MATKKATTVEFGVEEAYAYWILRTHRLLRWHFQRAMRQQGLTLTQEQFVMLSNLYHRDGCSQGELVNATFNDRANVSRIVTGLQRRGYLRRQPDPADGRGIRVFITGKGRELLARIGERVPQDRRVVYRGLTRQDLLDLRRICRTIEDNILGQTC